MSPAKEKELHPNHFEVGLPRASHEYLLRPILIFWYLTESDFWTFVIPNTAFGLFGALAGPVLTSNESASLTGVITRSPQVLAWNWLNLVVFDLANQRLPEAVTEDAINKPWRPIPAGLITPTQMRLVLLGALPTVLIATYSIGAWQETALLFGLTWMYNDLWGAEENFLLRNLLIGTAYALYNFASLRTACGPEHSVHTAGLKWIGIVAAVIFSTMHIQDLKDVVGDRARNRRSAPLVMGDSAVRWTLAIPIFVWSIICPWYLGLGFRILVLPATLGTYTAFRTLRMRDPKADRKSWYFWATWLICLYFLPLAKRQNVVPDFLRVWDV